MIERFQNATNSEQQQPLNLLTFLPISKDEEKAVCNAKPGKGYEKPEAFELLRKVTLGAPDPLPPLTTTTNSSSNSSTFPESLVNMNQTAVFRSSGKILCAVYTYSGGHRRVTGIAETWGWRCDGFFAASNETVDKPGYVGFGAIDLAHQGPETRYVPWHEWFCD
jgi:hypothetical protein